MFKPLAINAKKLHKLFTGVQSYTGILQKQKRPINENFTALTMNTILMELAGKFHSSQFVVCKHFNTRNIFGTEFSPFLKGQYQFTEKI